MKITELENGQRYLVDIAEKQIDLNKDYFADMEFVMALKWVCQAVSKDNARPVLTGCHFGPGKISAADGFRIHMMEWGADTAVVGFPEGIFKVVFGKDYFILHRVDGKYPDVTQIFGLTKDYQQDKNLDGFQIAFNPRFLSALAKFDLVKCKMSAPNHPALFECRVDYDFPYKLSALIMPMHL